MSAALYPWLHDVFARFVQMRAQGRTPQALLLNGELGVGVQPLAMHLAQTKLCHQPDAQGHACGQCAACRPFLAGAHPDFSLLEPGGKESFADANAEVKKKSSKTTPKEKRSTVIAVDDVRAFCGRLQLSSSFAHGKVGVIMQADAMTVQAANSLLKTLEEPPPGTLMILVTAHPARLPVTIRSRCQQWNIPLPTRDLAVDWLKRQPQLAAEDPQLLLDLAEGQPLAALALAEPEVLAARSRWLETLLHVLRSGANPVALAAAADREAWPQLLHWGRLLLVDLIRLHPVAQMDALPAHIALVNRDLADVLLPLARRLDASALFGLYDELIEAHRLLGHSLSRELQLEEFLIRFQRLGGHA